MADPIPGATDPSVTPPADAGKTGEGTTPPTAGSTPPEGSKPVAAGNVFDLGGDDPPQGAKPDDAPAAKPLDPNDPNAWLLSEGVMGNGPKPEWFKADKYKTVEEQAKAYVEAEKRFGAFVGAPKDGKYEPPPMPEGIQGEFLTDHPIFAQFQTWAAKSQLSQAGYNEVLGMLAQYEASQLPDVGAIKQSLGADADKRIGAVTGWAKANLPPESFTLYRELGATAEAAKVLQLMESVIGKVRSAGTPPTPTGEGAVGAASELETIQKLHGKRDASGKLLYDTDPKHRADVEKRYQEYYAKQK